MSIEAKLIEKYNVPVPRYTSYPTVPFWDKEKPDEQKWLNVVKGTFDECNESEGISIYIHLPFCESLCTYCGCNTRITKNHAVEQKYIVSLLNEWKIYLETFKEKPLVRELHLGGGTPTFFSPENLTYLITELLNDAEVHSDYEFGFEGHPNNTTKEHLQALYDVGFRRVSYGIQDLDLKVQKAINRIQPIENVEKVTNLAREIGYKSVSFDLIYGLPFQHISRVKSTIDKIVRLRPDRIAYYSYAHVPWMRPGQRSYSDKDLPDDLSKRALYNLGKSLLVRAGYTDIGMDHFALKSDKLYKAHENGTLHRNFMGYTTSNTNLLVGLGVSAISEAKNAYVQNIKKVEEYTEVIQSDQLGLFKGHFLTEQDKEMKGIILEIACNGEVDLNEKTFGELGEAVYIELEIMKLEGLISFENDYLKLTEIGNVFLRNVCSVFDLKLRRSNKKGEQIFSKAI